MSTETQYTATQAPASGKFSTRNLPLAVPIFTPAAILGLVALIMGILAINSANTLSQGQTDMYEKEVVPLSLMYDMQRQFQGSRTRAVALMAYLGEDISEQLAELDEREQGALDLVEEYRPLATDQGNINAIETAITEFHDDVRGEWAQLIETGNQSATAAYWENTLYPSSDAVNELMTEGASNRASSAQQLDADGTTLTEQTRVILIVVLLVGLIVGFAFATYVVREILTSIRRVSQSIDSLRAGDFTSIPVATSANELGTMVGSLGDAMTELRDTLLVVNESAGTLAAASEELSAGSTQVAAGAEETSAQAGVVAAAADQVTRNIQTVAAGAEEMGNAIREISQNASNAAQVASRAVSVSQTTAGTISDLGNGAREIGAVVNLITSIAEQTNLLALNATIEA
ncbi:methyl-accepting chemotaxis protein, partial [Jonesia quinghaiensis]|uniref:methyl-accepting chemotaxis protein n=1 Tax=Jonesia quinghaiensis TaxID=262806 RepID=UPI0006863663